jgi:hypothetical protein
MGYGNASRPVLERRGDCQQEPLPMTECDLTTVKSQNQINGVRGGLEPLAYILATAVEPWLSV